jgi:hypothetical protein
MNAGAEERSTAPASVPKLTHVSPRKVHRMSTFVLSVAMAAIGVVLVVQALTAASGVSTTRLLLGVLFLAAGVARCYVELRRGKEG